MHQRKVRLGGRQYRGSTKRTNRQAAPKVDATQRTRLLNSIQRIPNPTAVPTFAEFADQFLKWAKTNLAEAMVVLHRVNIDRLKQLFRGKLINEAELMGHANIQTTMIYVHAERKQKIEATARLHAYVEAARRAKQLQEER